MGPVGTSVVATAGDAIIASEFRHEYGSITDIDYDNGLKTRYAHASKVFVKVGDVVKTSERIILIGRAGRIAGPHLHFEVHINGVPQSPVAFLGNVGQPKMAANEAPMEVTATDIGKSMAAADYQIRLDCNQGRPSPTRHECVPARTTFRVALEYGVPVTSHQSAVIEWTSCTC